MKFTNISKKNKARLIFYPCFLMAVTASVFWMKWMPGESYQGKNEIKRQLGFKK